MHRETSDVFVSTPSRSRLNRLKKDAKSWAASAPVEPVKYIGVTLTYRPGEEWEPNDLYDFKRHIKRYYGDSLLGHYHVAEMQQRGAPHYHVVIAVTADAKSMPKPDKAGWWKKGSTNIQRIKNPKRYLLEYVKKASQKRGYPKGMRTYAGVWRKSAGTAHLEYRYRVRPNYVKERVALDDVLRIRRLPQKGTGWVYAGGKLERRSGWWWEGTFIPSPWFLWRIEDPTTGLYWNPDELFRRGARGHVAAGALPSTPGPQASPHTLLAGSGPLTGREGPPAGLLRPIPGLEPVAAD